MKRVLALVLAAVLVCSMTACLDHGEPDPLHPPGGNGSSKPTSEEPPVLTISDDSGNSLEALQGTYSWMYDRGDGYWMGVTADSLHPLQCQELLVPMETASDTVTLTFEVQPQDITVQCWRDVHFGNAHASGEQIAMDGNTLELKAGGYIYEVCANWTGENLAAAGTAHYSFYVIQKATDHTHKPVAEPQTVDDPVTGYCGNTITTIHLNGKEYSFMGSDSVNLTDILINLNYDPMENLYRLLMED